MSDPGLTPAPAPAPTPTPPTAPAFADPPPGAVLVEPGKDLAGYNFTGTRYFALLAGKQWGFGKPVTLGPGAQIMIARYGPTDAPNPVIVTDTPDHAQAMHVGKGAGLTAAWVDFAPNNRSSYAFANDGGQLLAAGVTVMHGGLLFSNAGLSNMRQCRTALVKKYGVYAHGTGVVNLTACRFDGFSENECLVRIMGGTCNASDCVVDNRKQPLGKASAALKVNGGTWVRCILLADLGLGQLVDGNKDPKAPADWTIDSCEVHGSIKVEAGCRVTFAGTTTVYQSGRGGIAISGSYHYNAGGGERGPSTITNTGTIVVVGGAPGAGAFDGPAIKNVAAPGGGVGAPGPGAAVGRIIRKPAVALP